MLLICKAGTDKPEFDIIKLQVRNHSIVNVELQPATDSNLALDYSRRMSRNAGRYMPERLLLYVGELRGPRFRQRRIGTEIRERYQFFHARDSHGHILEAGLVRLIIRNVFDCVRR